MASTIRRLAAILAADVAGYSRLIGADEEGTLGRLKALRAEGRCQVKQPQREIDVRLTVGCPYNVPLRYNPLWHRKRKLDKARLFACSAGIPFQDRVTG